MAVGWQDFLREESGVVSVEWLAVTGVLMVAGIVVVYELMSGGVAPIRQEVNSDFNRVQIQPTGG
ncbi:MAG: hypothetical protein AAGC57_04595 [Pseudomonadota bacterium]